MKKYRVWAEIDLKKLQHNISKIMEFVGPETSVAAVVKADAYGHGAVPVAKTSFEAGCKLVCVGDSNEAIQLREAGILAPLLVLGALIEEEIGWIVSYNIIPSIHSISMAKKLNQEAMTQNRILPVHINIDTGMGRLGISPKAALELIEIVLNSNNLNLEGISTHLSHAYEESNEFTMSQLSKFNSLLTTLKEKNIDIPNIHMANTGGLFRNQNTHFNLVRPGISIYGLYDPSMENKIYSLIPVMELKSQITFIKIVGKGTPIGYGGTYTTKRKSVIATLPVGYNDGYNYRLSNKGKVIINGKFAPIVGTVTMDYTTVDVTDIPNVTIGDEAVLIGKQGANEITVSDIANSIGTIAYEITCMLGKRVKRVYI